jgi:signal transduction histidine kinase
VQQRLEIETLRRGANGALTQIILLISMLAFVPSFPASLTYQAVNSVLIAIFAVRWLVYRKYRERPKLLILHYHWSIWLGTSTAVLWACSNSLAILHFRVGSFVGLSHVLLTTGLLAAVMYSLSPTPKFQKIYILVLGLTVSSVIFWGEVQGNYRYTGVLLLVFVIYLAMASRNHSYDLRSAFEFEEKLLQENEILRQTREELQIQKAKADFAARLAALGEMAGGVAHEINNPLAIIAVNADLLKSKLTASGIEPKIWLGHADKISEIVKRIARIVKSLQHLTRETSDQASSERVEVHAVVEETLDLCREKFKQKAIRLESQVPKNVWVWARHVELGQVLINLLNNAYDAVKEADEKVIRLSVQVEAEQVIVKIQDSGEGVSSDAAQKLFQPFFTTKAVGEGSGLGLSISRALLVKIGGDLVLSRTRNPTEFQVILNRSLGIDLDRNRSCDDRSEIKLDHGF